MDPDACLRRIADADDASEIFDACEDLNMWLSRGGFAPDWDACERGTYRFRQWQKAS